MLVYVTREQGKGGVLEIWDGDLGPPEFDNKFWTQAANHLGVCGERNAKDVVGSYAGVKPGEGVQMNMAITLKRVVDDAEKTTGGGGGSHGN